MNYFDSKTCHAHFCELPLSPLVSKNDTENLIVLLSGGVLERRYSRKEAEAKNLAENVFAREVKGSNTEE